MLTDAEIEMRLPVWVALAELFLDTSLDEADRSRIARIIRASPYDVETVEVILRDEVLPAFALNLLQIAGEWAGWSDEEVIAIMMRSLNRRSPIDRRLKQAILWRGI